jgi:hypothetical protein
MGSSGGDVLHIVLTGVLVLLLLASIAVGGMAFSRRFRNYSLATLLAVIVFGAFTAPFAAKLAAGDPTPWFGIVERVNVYASMLWIGVLSVRVIRADPVALVSQARTR